MSEDDFADLEDWDHGTIPRGVAELRLREEPVGTFLIRKGETRHGFSLSIVLPNKVEHYRVEENDGVFQLRGKEILFLSIGDLVSNYELQPLLVVDGVEVKLTKPCLKPEVEGGDGNYIGLVNVPKDEKVATQVHEQARKKSMSASLG
eukprot:m.5702 g.5702  ORF g.5702 m.5702 type:complete len:148 (-) comp2456_c0_seq1:412-855(-)